MEVLVYMENLGKGLNELCSKELLPAIIAAFDDDGASCPPRAPAVGRPSFDSLPLLTEPEHKSATCEVSFSTTIPANCDIPRTDNFGPRGILLC